MSAQVHDTSKDRWRNLGDGDYDFIHLMDLDGGWEVGDSSNDGLAMDTAVAFGRIIIEECHGNVVGTQAMEHLTANGFAGISGSNNQHPAHGFSFGAPPDLRKKEQPSAYPHSTDKKNGQKGARGENSQGNTLDSAGMVRKPGDDWSHHRQDAVRYDQ